MIYSVYCDIILEFLNQKSLTTERCWKFNKSSLSLIIDDDDYDSYTDDEVSFLFIYCICF